MIKFLFYTLFLLPLTAFSQAMSIQELWENLKDSRDYQRTTLKIGVKREENRTNRLTRFPVIYGDLTHQYNAIIPTTPVPAIAFDANAADGAIIPLRFSTRWIAKSAVQMEWKIFDPMQRGIEEEGRLMLDKIETKGREDEQQLKKNATLAYAASVLASLQYQSALKDCSIYNNILKVTELRFNAGRASAQQYRMAEQEMERRKIRGYEAYSVLEESHLELRRYVNLDTIFQLSSGIEDILTFVLDKDEIDFEGQIASLDYRIATMQIQQIKRQLLPEITFNAAYGTQFFSNQFDLFNRERWYGNSFANIAVKIPLSAHILKSTPLRGAMLNARIAKLDLDEAEYNWQIDNDKKRAKISATKLKLESYKKIENLALSQKEIARNAYEEGRILITEYNTADTDHIQAQQEVWNILYDLLKVSME
ncbi:TolC family protein [Sphingobacterium sp. LRF_L2]|uniref:TolC family protein n=1 Tax=Sphingobacterium sp. LRF_L2 TaxID=3369421 RepID=UPI003F5E1162